MTAIVVAARKPKVDERAEVLSLTSGISQEPRPGGAVGLGSRLKPPNERFPVLRRVQRAALLFVAAQTHFEWPISFRP